MLWQKDRRMAAGGLWQCRAKRREYNSRRQTDPGRRDPLLERRRAQWHAPNGGYVQRRRKELAAQRKVLHHQLEQLAKEAAEC